MKALFEILPASVEADKCILVIEVNNEGFSYAIKNEEQNMYVALAVSEFEKGSEQKEHGHMLQDFIQNQSLLNESFKKTFIMYSYPESVLIPFTLYSSLENENVLNLVHGDIETDTTILTDLVTESGVYNAFRVPASIHNLLNQKFRGAENIHQYSVLLKLPQPKGDMLNIIFYPNRILIKLNKNGHTELLNSYCYNTAEDVSYILLNACNQFEIKNIPVEIGGLIEKDSALYKEIYKYFEVINFATFPPDKNYVESISQNPAHYFSHIFAIDSCE